MKPRVAVIGAGVSGLTTATLLAEGGWPTTIFAAEVTPHTTSAAAAAIWYPYDAAPAEAVVRWSLRTYDVLRALSGVSHTGVSMLEQRLFVRTGEIEIPAWARSLGAERLAAADVPRCFASGFVLTVPLTDTTRYLGYLAERFC
ncbi:MAG TPA: FAD-dependent oxidoreductase, partial [Chthoniobacterales bacterium]|nr:FAD-dependent oxidoreductase [Chthoniobacterales bacterium]